MKYVEKDRHEQQIREKIESYIKNIKLKAFSFNDDSGVPFIS